MRNPSTIRFIKNPNISAQFIAVYADGYLIRFIDNPDESVKNLAVRRTPDAIRYIKNPSKELMSIAIGNNNSLYQIPGSANDLVFETITTCCYYIEGDSYE